MVNEEKRKMAGGQRKNGAMLTYHDGHDGDDQCREQQEKLKRKQQRRQNMADTRVG